MNGLCPSDKIVYTDTKGDKYCGHRYKKTDEDDVYKWEYATCHALIQQVDLQDLAKDKQEEIF